MYLQEKGMSDPMLCGCESSRQCFLKLSVQSRCCLSQDVISGGIYIEWGDGLLRLSGFQKRSTRISTLTKRNILFAHISPSVKVLNATDLAGLPEISASLQKVDFQRIVFADNG
jgi:hypothetical protein